MLTKQDFHGPEFYKFCIQEFQNIRERRNTRKGKPDDYDRIELTLDKLFESFYRSCLMDTSHGKTNNPPFGGAL